MPDPVTDGGMGDSIAISGDTMVVASAHDNSDIGAVYVYTGSGSTWTYEKTLTPSDGVANDTFGYSVAVSSSTIVVGAVLHSSAPSYPFAEGAAYIFQNGGAYTQEAELVDPGAAEGDFFGSAVAISRSTVLVSAPFEDNYEGAVFAYTENGSTWPTTPTDTLTAPGGSYGYGDLFGEGLAATSNTLVIGAPGAPGAVPPPTCNGSSAGTGCATGAVYVYKNVLGGFAQEAKLTASNGQGCSPATCSAGSDDMGGDYFGWSVALTGKTLAVGAPWASIPPAPDGGTSTTPNSTGAAYVFTGSKANWTQEDEVYDPAEVTTGGQDWFGYHVSVGAGATVVASAPYDPDGAAAGAAFVFAKEGSTWATYPTELTAPDGGDNDYFGYGGLTSTGHTYVLVGGIGGLYIFKK
jgi:hypothetical protein